MNSLNSSETIDCDVIGEKTFINQLLGEMKSQFNRTEKKSQPQEEDHKIDIIKTETDNSMNINENDTIKSSQDSEQDKSDENNVSTTEIKEEENNLDDEKPRIVLLFKKPNNDIKDTSPSRRTSLRNKSISEEKVDENVVKRSSRRRSKDCNESVLQSAIARKEKSYNESNKPQRLSRPLKPTKKILENLELAKQEHKSKSERTKSPTKTANSDGNYDGLTDDEINTNKRKHKHQHSNKTSKRHSKRIRSFESDKESDSDLSGNLDDGNHLEAVKCTRRSQRISSSRLREESSMDAEDVSSEFIHSITDQSNYPSDDPECSAVGAELIQSRLCLCTKNTQLYAAIDKNELTYCTAVDNVGERMVGCSRKCENLALLRPSRRVPYIMLCELHKHRLLRHNCCPTCGVFCTQGKFVECNNHHQYHRECQISVGNMECCPHCGLSTPPNDVQITMHSEKKPVILPFQKSQYPTAKMSFQSNNIDKKIEDEDLPLIDNDLLPIIDNITIDEEFTENDLLEAIKTGDLERLAVILSTHAVDFNFKIADFNDGTILHYAAQAGLLVIVHMLIVAGMEVDAFDKEQNTALMLAICSNRNEIVQYLIRAGANITLKGTDGMTALHLASKCGNLNGCQLLLKAGQELHNNFVNSQDDGGWTPLVWACEHGYVDVVNYLILNGADVSLRDVEHNVALHWAAFSGSSRIIELLLNIKGCDVNAVNAHGDTPLHIGAREDRYNCIIILLSRGADVTLVNKNNETALDCVPEGGESCKVIALNVYLQGVTCSEYGKRKIILTNDISKGKETNPIQCINMVDDEDLPTNYIYITKNCVTTENICIDTKISTMNSCSCEERCTMDFCSCTKMSLKCWYDDDGKLSSDFNYSDSPLIFECNEGCNCNTITCNNRVVQKGLTQRFQLNKTLTKGWSVNTLRFIPKGGFVCEYIGEILTDVEADQREDDSYLFDLDNRDGESFCIDAKYYGNFARFINHSCKPNLHPVKVFIEHQDLRFPRIALFANRDIMADEELSFDYGDKFWLVKCKSFTCQCESPECRYSSETIQETINNYNKKILGNESNNID